MHGYVPCFGRLPCLPNLLYTYIIIYDIIMLNIGDVKKYVLGVLQSQAHKAQNKTLSDGDEKLV